MRTASFLKLPMTTSLRKLMVRTSESQLQDRGANRLPPQTATSYCKLMKICNLNVNVFCLSLIFQSDKFYQLLIFAINYCRFETYLLTWQPMTIALRDVLRRLHVLLGWLPWFYPSKAVWFLLLLQFFFFYSKYFIFLFFLKCKFW